MFLKHKLYKSAKSYHALPPLPTSWNRNDPCATSPLHCSVRWFILAVFNCTQLHAGASPAGHPSGLSRARWRGPASPARARALGSASLGSAAPPGVSGAWPTFPGATRARWPRCPWSWRGTERASEGLQHPLRKCHHLREEESNTCVRGEKSSSHHNTGQAWL